MRDTRGGDALPHRDFPAYTCVPTGPQAPHPVNDTVNGRWALGGHTEAQAGGGDDPSRCRPSDESSTADGRARRTG